MRVVVATFNQEKALVGAFSVIVQLHLLLVYSTSYNFPGGFYWLMRWRIIVENDDTGSSKLSVWCCLIKICQPVQIDVWGPRQWYETLESIDFIFNWVKLHKLVCGLPVVLSSNVTTLVNFSVTDRVSVSFGGLSYIHPLLWAKALQTREEDFKAII